MNYLEEAKNKIDQSQGDVRDSAHKARLTELAMVYAAIAQAEAAARQADALHEIAKYVHDILTELEFGTGLRVADNLNGIFEFAQKRAAHYGYDGSDPTDLILPGSELGM